MKISNATAVIIAAILLFIPMTIQAVSAEYTFGLGDQRNTITFESETDFETILGSTTKLSGVMSGDIASGNLSLSLTLPVASLKTGIELRDKHLRSEHWLDAGKYPEITFVSTSMKLGSGNNWTVSGNLTMHGVTQPLTTTVDMREIPVELAKKAGLGPINWVRLTTSFTVKLSDFGVKIPDMAAAKVNDEWSLKIQSFAGADSPGK